MVTADGSDREALLAQELASTSMEMQLVQQELAATSAAQSATTRHCEELLEQVADSAVVNSELVAVQEQLTANRTAMLQMEAVSKKTRRENRELQVLLPTLLIPLLPALLAPLTHLCDWAVEGSSA